jgi:hypothetical protein
MDIETWMIVVFSLLLGMRLGMGLGRSVERSKRDREEKDKPCPHGYDWDDCPDCRH